jgi:hypothetical protein
MTADSSHKKRLCTDLVCLLGAAALVNIFIFQAKSSLPFRPPYAIYLLPLVLLLAAAGFQVLTERMANPRVRAVRRIPALFGAVLIISILPATKDVKAFYKKTQWHHLSEYLESQFDHRHLLVFGSLTDGWKPTFYGFARYYNGHSQRVSIASIPYLGDRVLTSVAQPVLILFYYRNYYLTERSPFPIMAGRHPDLAAMVSDSAVAVKHFKGLIVLKRTQFSGNLASDMADLLQWLLAKLPDAAYMADFNLAAAVFEFQLDDPEWKRHLCKAYELALLTGKVRIEKMIFFNRAGSCGLAKNR